MNKMHWNTITIGGDVADSELRDMIAHSYDRIKPKKRAVVQIPWPENFYRELFGDKYTATPTNAEELIDYAVNNLVVPRNHKRAVAMALLRFKEGKTYVAIGVAYGIGPSRASQLVAKAIRLLKHSSRLRYFVDIERAKSYDELTKKFNRTLRDKNSKHMYSEQALKSWSDINIADLELSQPTLYCLEWIYVETLADLVTLTLPEIRNIKNLSEESLDEIIVACSRRNIVLAESW
jgi:hypothetical protein